jgi:hypothetical protein
MENSCHSLRENGEYDTNASYVVKGDGQNIGVFDYDETKDRSIRYLREGCKLGRGRKIRYSDEVLVDKSVELLPTESLDMLVSDVVSNRNWVEAQRDFNASKVVYIIGNGGNLAVADHASVDVTRLSGKLGIAPGSGILATSVIGDSSFDDWFTNWLNAHTCNLEQKQLSESMVIGVSSSGTARNVCKCLLRATELGMKALMISARNTIDGASQYRTVCIGTDYYHTGEVVSLMLFYQLIHGSGASCPTISGKIGRESFDRIINPKSLQERH